MENKQLYQSEVESYLQDNNVYDIFEEMLNNLLTSLPEDPVDFLLEKLVSPPGKILYFIGNNGAQRRELVAEYLKNEKNTVISMHDVLKSHLENKGAHHAEISECFSQKKYISDETILGLLEPELKKNLHLKKNIILEGVPRTRVQALALHAGGVIPSRILILTSKGLEKHDDNYHVSSIKEIYPSLCYEAFEKSHFLEVLSTKLHSNGPRKPPHVIILGPPGAGRSTQAKALASKYRLSFVSPGSLLRDQIQRKTDLAPLITAHFSKGEYVPDEILTRVIIERLKETDCVLNGWILDGFPKTAENLSVLRQNKIKPSHVFFLECSDSLVYERTEERRIDPLTGVFYNVTNPPTSNVVKNRLIIMPEDTHVMVKKRLQIYKENLQRLKEEFADVAHFIDAKEPALLVSEKISDALENNISIEFR